MPVPKLKNLTIVILLVANLILAFVVFPTRAGSQQEEDAFLQSLCELYAAQEITLDPDTIADTALLYVLELGESSDSDVKAATALLGQQLLAEDDSTRYVSAYRSSLGQCIISRSGDFSATLTGSKTSDPEDGSLDILEKMGFDHLPLPEPHQVHPGLTTVTATQTILDIPIFSGGLTLTFTDDGLTALEGSFFTGTGSPMRVSENACITAADALVAFLDARYDLGWVGSEIVSLQQGYVRSETAAATAVRLSPVWLIETDTGSFFVHGMTKDITPVNV